jgi:hypothetical protein
MLAATLGLTGIGWLAAPAGLAASAGDAPPIAIGIAVLGALCALAVPILARKLLAPAQISRQLPAADLALARRYLLAGHLALWSFSTLPAILGLAQLLLDGAPATHLALCALSLLALAWLMPTARRVGAGA